MIVIIRIQFAIIAKIIEINTKVNDFFLDRLLKWETNIANNADVKKKPNPEQASSTINAPLGVIKS